MYLITALQGRAAEVLYGIPINATYEETLQTLEDRFGDEHLTVAYRSQLKEKKPEGRGILARICHISRTACPPRLPDTTRRTHKARGRKSLPSRGSDW
jgi:hypothetical protein